MKKRYQMVQQVIWDKEGKRKKVGVDTDKEGAVDTDEEGGEKEAGKRSRWTMWHHEKKQGVKEKNRTGKKKMPLTPYTGIFLFQETRLLWLL